jgi:nucleoside-diphosphate-sugar epimerase
MKILITGGAGYVGSHVAIEALFAGHEVLIYDNYLSASRRASSGRHSAQCRELQSHQPGNRVEAHSDTGRYVSRCLGSGKSPLVI